MSPLGHDLDFNPTPGLPLPPEPPKLWNVRYYDWDQDYVSLTVQGYQYDMGTYFFFLPDGGIHAVSMGVTGYVYITPVSQGDNSEADGGPAVSEQAKDQRQQRPVQASRWQLP